jgi:hypothetical protein
MLIDLVDKFGLERVGPVGTPPNPALHRPAVLVVLEGTLRIGEPDPDPPTILTPGTYALYQRPLLDVNWSGGAVVHAAQERTVRVFVVTHVQQQLPRILLNVLDENEFQKLLLTL